MNRVKFVKGNQKEFLKLVMKEGGCPSLIEFSRRMGVNYSSLKNYYSGVRLLTEELYLVLSPLIKKKFEVKFISGNWGQVKGGKKRGKSLRNI